MTSTTPPTYETILTTLLSHPSPVLPPPKRPATTSLSPLPRHASLTPQIAALSLHPCLETLLHILNADLTSAHFYVRHMQAPPRWEGMLLHALLHRYEGDLENARAWYGDISGSGVMEFVWGGGGDDDGGDGDGGAKLDDREGLRGDAAKAVEHDEECGNRRTGGPDGKEVADEEDPNEPGSKAAKATNPVYKRASRFLDENLALNKTLHVPDKFEGLEGQSGAAAWKETLSRLERQSSREVRRLLAWCEAKYGMEEYVDASDAWVRPSEKIQKMAKDQMMGGEGWRDF